MNELVEFCPQRFYYEMLLDQLIITESDGLEVFGAACDLLHAETRAGTKRPEKLVLPEMALLAYAALCRSIDQLRELAAEFADLLTDPYTRDSGERMIRDYLPHHNAFFDAKHDEVAWLVSSFDNFNAIFESKTHFEAASACMLPSPVPYEIWRAIHENIFFNIADKDSAFDSKAQAAFKAYRDCIESFCLTKQAQECKEAENRSIFLDVLPFIFKSISMAQELERPVRHLDRAVSGMRHFQGQKENLDSEILFAFQGYHVVDNYQRDLFNIFERSKDTSANEKSNKAGDDSIGIRVKKLETAMIDATKVFANALSQSSFMRLGALHQRKKYEDVFTQEFRERFPFELSLSIFEKIFLPLTEAKEILANSSGDSADKILKICFRQEAFNGWADFANFVCGNPSSEA